MCKHEIITIWVSSQILSSSLPKPSFFKILVFATMPPKALSPESRRRKLVELELERKLLLEATQDSPDEADEASDKADEDQEEKTAEGSRTPTLTPRKKYTDDETLQLQERILKMKEEAQRFPEEFQKIIIEKWAAIDRQSTDNGIIIIAYERVLKEIREAATKKREEAAEAKKREKEAAAKKHEQAAEAKKREEAAEAKKREKEAAAKKREEEAVAKKREEEAAAKKREEEAAAKKREEEAAAKKHEEEAAAKKREEEAAAKKREEEAAAKKRGEAAAKKREEEAAAKKREEEQLEEELNRSECTNYTHEQEDILASIGEFADSLPKPTQTTFYKGLEEIRLQTPGDIDSRLRRFLYLKKTIEEKMKRQEEDVHLSEEEVQAEVAQTSAQSGNEEQDAEETEEEKPEPVKRGPGRPRKFPLQTPEMKAKAKGRVGRPPKERTEEPKVKRRPGRPPKVQVPQTESEPKVKRRPGRPPKVQVPQTESEPKIKRRPGRPRKTPSEEVQDSQPNTPESDAESQETSKRRHSDVSSISMSSNKKPRVAGTYSGPDSFSNSNLHL